MASPFLALIPVIGELLNKVIPDPQARADAQIKMMEIAQRGEFRELDANLQTALAQIEVNKLEAMTSGIFRGGWRPAAGWGCVIIGIFYPAFRIVLPWALTVAGVDNVPVMPALDTTEAMTMLLGLLGLGGMRTVERMKNKA